MSRRRVSFDLHSPNPKVVPVVDRDVHGNPSDSEHEIQPNPPDPVEPRLSPPSFLRTPVTGIFASPVASSDDSIQLATQSVVPEPLGARREIFNGSDGQVEDSDSIETPAPITLDSRTQPAFEEDDIIEPSHLGQNQSIVLVSPAVSSQNNESLDSSDIGFSQEACIAATSNENSVLSEELGSQDNEISTAELRGLRYARDMTTYCASGGESGASLCEDLHSRIYHDFDDERFSVGPWEDVQFEEERSLRDSVTPEELQARAQAQRSGGLPIWDYESPFAEISVRVDDVNDTLERRFLEEANEVLNKVTADIEGRVELGDDSEHDEDVVSPLSCLQSFISDCLLEKLRYGANRVLHHQKEKGTTKEELLGLIILHVLCASYDESPSTICDELEGDFFFQMGIKAERYHQVWAALGGSREGRSTHDTSATGWSRSANRATTLITEIEGETAAINRDLLYVPRASVLSLDDDHLRMASRAVMDLTYLRQHNNPKKGLGPVGNAVCSALNPFFLACHFTRNGEKLLHTWERLVQLLQGVSTTGSLRPMPEAIFAADRGYNSKETIAFISDVLGASLLGTHKRDLWFPFVFGDGPISRRHNGMVVSERGCRAVYTARLKDGRASGAANVRAVEACVYRESCSGRIAALVHNNGGLFPSRCFTIVCRDSYRAESSVRKLETALTVYDDPTSEASTSRRPTRSQGHVVPPSNGRGRVQQVISRVRCLTYLQSEDPVWFLLRAFRFTSRTGFGFIQAVARDYVARMKGLAWLLRGSTLTAGTQSLGEDAEEVRQHIKTKWESVIAVLGLRLADLPVPSSRRATATVLTGMSASRINSSTKSDLNAILATFDRALDSRVPKSSMLSAVTQLKADIVANSVDLDSGEPEDASSEARSLRAASNVSNAFREAALQAWVMKPLVATAGMREGTRNEGKIIEAIPDFMKKSGGAFRCAIGTSIYKWDDAYACNVIHIRCTGLVESLRCEMVADSPDAILAANDEEGDINVFAVEVKTMTSVRTIESATAISELYGPVVSLENVGTSDRSTALFKEIVPTAAYRAQLIHHAATLGVNNVLYVVGTGGSMTEGRILYVCDISFTEELRHNYTYCMDCVRTAAFGWVGEGPERVPKEYDSLLQNSHASDLYSFISYYGLSQAIRKEVINREAPIPPARMIRLTPAVYWNNLKGGVDVISRYMKTLARSNISESPVVSIIARLLSMQVNNAAVAYRLHKARCLKALPAVEDISSFSTRGYSALRHKVTQCETFGVFARHLAKQWVDNFSPRADDEPGSENESESATLKPMFSRKASERYNVGTHKARRLNKRIAHKRVSGPSTYCVLCSWSLRGEHDGKMKVKRKGSRQVQWCSSCKQAICTACWSEWHSRDTLKRARPTAAEKRAFEQSIRSVRRRGATN